MTDAEKIAHYDRVAEIVANQITLEKHLRRESRSLSNIEFSRSEAYRQIVDVVVAVDTLLLLGPV